MSPTNDSSRKTAVVTGGGTGLGLACVKRLMREGYQVHVLGKDTEEDLRDPSITFTDFDVTNEAAALDFAASIGEVDTLVNAAGIILHDRREFSTEGFRRVVDVNLHGTQIMASALHANLKARKGSVLNFASMWSVFGSGRNPAYSASKGAVLQLTRSLAVAWAEDGIRVNAVAPGWIKTRMSVNAMTDPVRSEAIMRRVPLGYWGDAEDVAAAAWFLISPEARYISGVMLPIDGGYSIA